MIRYVIKAGPLNIPSIFFWLVALGSLGIHLLQRLIFYTMHKFNEFNSLTDMIFPGAMGASILFKFLGKKKSVDGIERGASGI